MEDIYVSLEHFGSEISAVLKVEKNYRISAARYVDLFTVDALPCAMHCSATP